MLIKIHKRYNHPVAGWLPYLMIRTYNVSKEEYAEMHANSDYANCRYDIIKEED